MNARKTVFLAIFAVALLITALWYSNARRPQQESGVAEPAVPGLAARLNDLDRVVITGPGKQVLATLLRADGQWRLEERNYPADAAKLRELLVGLAEARRIEAKTSNPELYSRLGVQDIDKTDAGGVQIELAGGGEPVLLIVGENNPRGKGTYVRRVGEAQSWLVDRNIAVDKSPANWLNRELVDVQPDRIDEVVVERGKDRVEIAASEAANGDFVLRNLPKGREPASDYVADATAGLLQGLRFEDVAAADSMAVDAASRRTARFVLRDGVRVDVESWQADGKTWAKLAARLDEASATAAIEAQQAKAKAEWERKLAEKAADAAKNEGEGKAESATAEPNAAAPEPPLAVKDPAADREQRLSALRNEVETLNQRFNGRAFVLPTYKASNLNRDLEAYLKPKG